MTPQEERLAEEFREWADSKGISRSEYVIDDYRTQKPNPRDIQLSDVYCLDPTPAGDWLLYYTERGQRMGMQEFVSLDAALAALKAILS